MNVNEEEFLSKNKQRKTNRYKNEVEKNKSRRKQEQGKQREKFKQYRQDGGLSKEELKNLQRSRLTRALEIGLKVCIDFQFEGDMMEKELNHFANQAKRVYGSNKSAENPFNLYFINLSKSSKTYQICCQKNDGFENYLLHSVEEGIEELFDLDTVVYLSPDSETTLETFDPETVYVIGGLVDDSVKKNTSIQYSESVGIKTARLPITDYMKRAEIGSFKQILTINQVFDILLDFHASGDWSSALEKNIPPKTGFIMK